MKTTKYLLLMALFLILGTIACKKDRIEKSKNEYEPVNTYLDAKKQPEQEFIITGPSNDTIVGNQRTRLLVGRECLQFPNNDTVAYPFSVKLVELYTPKDMIYWQIPTVAAGNIMETHGEVRVRATKNNTDLVLKPNCFYQLQMPNTNPQANKNIFYGFDTGNFIDWTTNLAALGVSTPASATFNVIPTFGYDAFIPRLGWVNCGLTANNGSGSTLSFTSQTDELTNLGIFIYFPATKSVMQVYNTVSGLIPNGSTVKIIMIGITSGGQLFHYFSSLTINSSGTIDVVLTPISDTNLTAILDGL